MAEKFTALQIKHLRVPGTYYGGRNLYLNDKVRTRPSRQEQRL